jgi:hypothetical protein
MKTTDGPVLVLQDTTTFSYQRERPELIGYTGKTTLRTGKTAWVCDSHSRNAAS